MFFFMLANILYYSFGYKYNMQDGTTIQTGIIVLKISPKDVNVYNNGQIIKINRSITSFLTNIIKIENLSNGEYNIQVQKDGYHNWEKNIITKEGLATSFVNIILLKENYDKKIIIDEVGKNLNLKSIWGNNQQDKIIYKNDNNLNIFDLENNNKTVVSNFENIVKNNTQNNYEIENVIWSNDSTKLIIKIAIEEKSNWYLIDLENKNMLSNLNNVFGKSSELRKKSNTSLSEFLYYTKENNLYRLNYQTLSSEKILDNVASFLIQDNNIYFLSKNDNKLYSASINDILKIKTVATMPNDFNNLLGSKITKTNRKTFSVLSSSGNLYFINEDNEVIFINSFVEKSEFSNDNNKIIYNNKHEIWIYYTELDAFRAPEKSFANNLITRFSGIINNVYLYEDNEHLLYKEGNAFKFLEIDDRGKRNVFELMKINNDNIFYTKYSNSLFYIEDDKLLQIDLNEE